MTVETYSVEQIYYENVELGQPVSEERLIWLLDRLETLEQWADRMPADFYRAQSPLWKSWAQARPELK